MALIATSVHALLDNLGLLANTPATVIVEDEHVSVTIDTGPETVTIISAPGRTATATWIGTEEEE